MYGNNLEHSSIPVRTSCTGGDYPMVRTWSTNVVHLLSCLTSPINCTRDELMSATEKAIVVAEF